MSRFEDIKKSLTVRYEAINKQPSNQITVIFLKGTNQAIQHYLEEHDVLTKGTLYVQSLYSPTYYQLDLFSDNNTLSKQWFDSDEGLRVCALFMPGPFYEKDKGNSPEYKKVMGYARLNNALKSIVSRIFSELEVTEMCYTGNNGVSVEAITFPFINEDAPIYHFKRVKNETLSMDKLEVIDDKEIENYLKDKYGIPSSVWEYIKGLR